MPGKGRVNGYICSFPITNLANQNYVWILANHGAQPTGKGEIDLWVHLHLAYAVHLIFNWILDSENVLVWRVNVAERCI